MIHVFLLNGQTFAISWSFDATTLFLFIFITPKGQKYMICCTIDLQSHSLSAQQSTSEKIQPRDGFLREPFSREYIHAQDCFHKRLNPTLLSGSAEKPTVYRDSRSNTCGTRIRSLQPRRLRLRHRRVSGPRLCEAYR